MAWHATACRGLGPAEGDQSKTACALRGLIVTWLTHVARTSLILSQPMATKLGDLKDSFRLIRII